MAPTLTKLMIHQAKVKSHLEQLEMSSGPPSVDEEDVAERTRLLQLGEHLRPDGQTSEPRNTLGLRGVQATIPEESGIQEVPMRVLRSLQALKGSTRGPLRGETVEQCPSRMCYMREHCRPFKGPQRLGRSPVI